MVDIIASEGKPMFSGLNMPTSVRCKICNKQFFERSFPFHIKTCVKTNYIADCPETEEGKIQKYMIRSTIVEMMSSTTATTGNSMMSSTGRFSKRGGSYRRVADSHGRYNSYHRTGSLSPSNINITSLEEYPSVEEPAALIACSCCNRTFTATRIKFHESICRQAKQQDEIRKVSSLTSEREISQKRSLSQRRKELSKQSREKSRELSQKRSRTKRDASRSLSRDNFGEGEDGGRFSPSQDVDDRSPLRRERRQEQLQDVRQQQECTDSGAKTLTTLSIYTGNANGSSSKDAKDINLNSNQQNVQCKPVTPNPHSVNSHQILTRCPSRPSASRDGVFHFTALNTVLERPPSIQEERSSRKPSRKRNKSKRDRSNGSIVSESDKHALSLFKGNNYNNHSLAILDNINNHSVAVNHFPTRNSCGPRRFYSTPALENGQDSYFYNTLRGRGSRNIHSEYDTTIGTLNFKDQHNMSHYGTSYSTGYSTSFRTGVRFADDPNSGRFLGGEKNLIVQHSKKFAGASNKTKAAQLHASEWGRNVASGLDTILAGIQNGKGGNKFAGIQNGKGINGSNMIGNMNGSLLSNPFGSVNTGMVSTGIGLFSSTPVLTHY